MVKDIRHLSRNTRFIYGKILFAGIMELEDLDTRIVEEFYRVLSYIDLPVRERKKVFEWYLRSKGERSYIDILTENYPSVIENLNEQEERVMGYMLLEDNYRVMYANRFDTDEKARLHEELRQFLNMKEEQFPQGVNPDEDDGEFTATGGAKISGHLSGLSFIGVPLLMLYYSKHNAYRHDFRSFGLLQIEKRLQKDNQYFSIGSKLMTGAALSLGLKWLMDRKKKEKMRTMKIIKQEEERFKKATDKMIQEDKRWFLETSNEAMDSYLKNFKIQLMKY